MGDGTIGPPINLGDADKICVWIVFDILTLKTLALEILKTFNSEMCIPVVPRSVPTFPSDSYVRLRDGDTGSDQF